MNDLAECLKIQYMAHRFNLLSSLITCSLYFLIVPGPGKYFIFSANCNYKIWIITKNHNKLQLFYNNLCYKTILSKKCSLKFVLL